MNNMNSGYVGYSMSVRANEAYNRGEKPYSKWTKQDILNELDYSIETMQKIKKYPVKTLKEIFLYKSSWHHTSSYANCTNFYSVSNIDEENVIMQLESYKPEQKEENNIQYVRFEYLEWGGTRKHPKATKRESVGILKGNWIHYNDGKKNLSTNGVKILTNKDSLKGNTFTIEEKEILKKLRG